MMKVHPDRGGNAALSRQVREAYEFLTRKKKGTSQGSSGSASAEYDDGAEERRKREEEARRRKTEEQRRRSEEEQRKRREEERRRAEDAKKRREEERIGKWRAHGRNREKLAKFRLNLENNRINLYASFLKFMGIIFLFTVFSALFTTFLPDIMMDYLMRLPLNIDWLDATIVAIFFTVIFSLCFYHLGDDRVYLIDHSFDADIDIINSKKI